MAKTKLERITTIEERILQLQNQKKQLVQKQKEDERKARTNRLCRRHGLLEKFIPSIATITDEQFELFIKVAINTKHGQDRLAEIVDGTLTAYNARKSETVAQSPHTSTAKPTQPVHINTTAESANADGGATAGS